MPATMGAFTRTLSPLTSSSMASHASSVVTMPKSPPRSSTTGMAGRSYLKMSAATSSSVSSGVAVMMSSNMTDPTGFASSVSTSVRRESTPTRRSYSLSTYT